MQNVDQWGAAGLQAVGNTLQAALGLDDLQRLSIVAAVTAAAGASGATVTACRLGAGASHMHDQAIESHQPCGCASTMGPHRNTVHLCLLGFPAGGVRGDGGGSAGSADQQSDQRSEPQQTTTCAPFAAFIGAVARFLHVIAAGLITSLLQMITPWPAPTLTGSACFLAQGVAIGRYAVSSVLQGCASQSCTAGRRGVRARHSLVWEHRASAGPGRQLRGSGKDCGGEAGGPSAADLRAGFLGNPVGSTQAQLEPLL